MVSFLIAYATWSGNTQEVAEIIEETLLKTDIDVTYASNWCGARFQIHVNLMR